MRTVGDRIRHAISFEIIGLLLVTPLGAFVFHMPAAEVGVVGIVAATIATAWNYLYNLGFDRMMQRFTGSTRKSTPIRVFHALSFEAGLLVLLLPMMAAYLGIDLWQALVMDLSFAAFYVVYAFVFNWAYDRAFPLSEWQAEGV